MATASVPAEDDRDVECPVCHEPFRTPKMLPCGHTICLSPCLQQLAKDRDSVKCPECRADHNIPGGTVEGFPTNIFIIRMMKPDVIQKLPASSFCPLCNSEEPLVKCFHCSVFMCEGCRMVHTKELKSEVLKFLADCAEHRDFVRDTAMKQASTALDDQVQTYLDTIETAVAALMEAVRQRRAKLVEQVGEFEKQEQAVISYRVRDVEDRVDRLQEFCTKAISDVNAPSTIPMQNQLLRAKQEVANQLNQLEEAKSNISNIKQINLFMDIGKLLGTIQELGEINEFDSEDEYEDAEDVLPTTEPQLQTEQKKLSSPSSSSAENSDVRNRNGKTSSADSSPVVPGPSSPAQAAPILSLSKRDCSKLNRCVGRTGREDGQFERPRCLAVCPKSGNVVVGDWTRCHIFNAAGEHVKTLTKCVSNFGYIDDIAVSNSGHMYVRCENTLHIFRYPIEPFKSFRMSDVACYSICADPGGLVHVCFGTEGVKVYNEQGEMCDKYIVKAEGPFDARQIAISSKKDIYITNVWDQSEQHYFYILNSCYQLIRCGKVPKTISGRIEYYICYPGKMKMIEDKYILFTHESSHRVYLFDLNWKLVKTFGVKGHCRGQIYYPVGADVTKDGELVVISQNNMLQFF